MKSHLQEEALAGLVLGSAAVEARAHAAECGECAARAAEAGEVLARIREVSVPEPEGPFWSDFQRELRSRIAGDRPHSLWSKWLVPVAATAAAAALAIALQQPKNVSVPERPVFPALQAWSPLPAAEEDTGLPVLEGLFTADEGAVDWDEGRGLAPFLAGLTDEDSAALAGALRGAGEEGAL